MAPRENSSFFLKPSSYQRGGLQLAAIIADVGPLPAAKLTEKLRNLWEDAVTSEGTICAIKILFLLGADPMKLDERKEIHQGKRELIDLVVEIKTMWQNGHAEEERRIVHRPEKLFAVSLDGGGIRGIILGLILRFVTGRMFGCDEKIKEQFHWFIGTSTGGIISLSLTQNDAPKTPSDCVQFYWKLKKDVFMEESSAGIVGNLIHGNEKFQTQKLVAELEREFGEHQCFVPSTVETAEDGHGFVPRIAITALEASIVPGRLKLFRNYDNVRTNYKEDEQMSKGILLRLIAQATSAAPTYFEKCRIGDSKKYIDGGLCANCPITALLKEIDHLYPTVALQNEKIGGILSIGTGHKKVQPRTKTSCPFIRLDLLKQQATGEDGHALSCAIERCKVQGIHLLRLSPENIDVALNERKDVPLIEMMWTTLKYVNKPYQIAEIDRFAKQYRSSPGA